MKCARQCSDHSFFTTALAIAYGKGNLFVSLSEIAFSAFIRSEVLHHGRTNLRTSGRKYFYIRAEREDPANVIYQDNIGAFRLLELLLSDDRESLAQTLSYFAVQRRCLGFPLSPPLRASFCRCIRNAVREWLDKCYQGKVALGRLIDDKIQGSGVPPTVAYYRETLGNEMLDLQNRGSNVLSEALNAACHMLKDKYPAEEKTINVFWGSSKDNILDSLKKEWKDHFSLLFSMSTRCRALYDSGALTQTGGDCKTNQRFEKYIGFVDFRPRAGSSPIAMALLVPPENFLPRDVPDGGCVRHADLPRSEFTIILGDYARPFGMVQDRYQYARLEVPPNSLNIEGEPWESSFYAMHDSAKESGARCAHLCIIMACGLLSSDSKIDPNWKIARIPGPFEVSFLAAKVDYPNSMDAPTGPVAWEFDPTEGLTPGRIVEVLENDCKVSAFFYRRDYDQTTAFMLERLLKAYLSAGFPVIMFCNADGLYEPDSLPDTNIHHHEAAHCVLINGFRSDNSIQRLTHLVIHDPGYAPFLAIPTDRCFKSAAKYEEKESINIVAVTRSSIKTDAANCLEGLFGIIEKSESARRHFFPGKSGEVFPPDMLKCGFDVEIELMNGVMLDEKVFAANALEPLKLPNSCSQAVNEAVKDARESLEGSSKSRMWVARVLSQSDRHTVMVCMQNAEAPDRDVVVIAPEFPDCSLPAKDATKSMLSSDSTVSSTEPEPSQASKGLSFTPSVITSSSPMDFPALTRQLSERKEKKAALDVFLLRTRDILRILDHSTIRIDPDTVSDIAWLLQKKVIPRNGLRESPDEIINVLKYDHSVPSYKKYLKLLLERGYVSAIDVLAFEDANGDNPNIDIVRNWIKENLNSLKIAAFSTHFPQIASEHIGPRAKAVTALKNCMKLAMQLSDAGCLWGEKIVIEVVGGSFLDRTVQYGTGRDVVRVRDRNSICSLVARSLVAAYRGAHANDNCTFSMELEPGACYLINGLQSVRSFIAAADTVIAKEKIDKGAISLNLDIGHYISAEIVPGDISGAALWNRFSHSHISCLDRGNQHYRDLPVIQGCFKEVNWHTAIAYIKEYSTLSGTSGATSLELEGCSSYSWISESLNTLFGLT